MMIAGLGQVFGALQLATAQIAERGLNYAEEAAAAATDYLRPLGMVAMGYCFARATASFLAIKAGKQSMMALDYAAF